MKVLHVISGLTVGGAEAMLCKLVEEMRKEGHASVVVCLGPRGPLSDRLEASGAEVHHLSARKGPGLLTALWKAGLLARRARPDVVQGWMSHGNLAALVVAAFCTRSERSHPGKRSPPVFWSVHQSLYSLRHESIANAATVLLCGLLSPLPRAIAYVSVTAARQHERFGFDAGKSVALPVGFDIRAFVPLSREQREVTRRRLGLAPEPGQVWIGLVGRDDPKKDAENFLRAAARLASNFPETRFVLLGRGMDPPRDALRALANVPELAGRVRFEGETTEPAAWIASLDILASASYTEAFPNVIGEAMACGVPCAATNVGDSFLLLGEGGLTARPRDPVALAEALAVLVAIGPEGRRETGKRGRFRIEERFTVAAMAERFLSLYRR